METEKKIEIERGKLWHGDVRNTRSNQKSKCIRSQFQRTWQQTIPCWEKKFCTSVCSIPWKKLCETEKLRYMYPKIVEWDDSEGEEAFHNAKARYWEEINHLPRTVPLPDPDMYIDIIDHNAVISPELVEDLDKHPSSSQDGEDDQGISWDSFQFTTETVPVTGWGDEEDQVHTIYATDQSIQIQPTGWGDEQDKISNTYIMGKWNEIQPTGWGDEENPSNGNNHNHVPPWNNYKPKNNCGDYHCRRDYSWKPQVHRDGDYNRKESGGSHFHSDHRTERYRGRKKSICAVEQTLCYKSCDPINHRGSADSHDAWQWQKSVS